MQFRIVRDNYSGYEVQVTKKILWFTVWRQCGRQGVGGTNTHPSIEEAEEFIPVWIERTKRGRHQEVVKEVKV